MHLYWIVSIVTDINIIFGCVAKIIIDCSINRIINKSVTDVISNAWNIIVWNWNFWYIIIYINITRKRLILFQRIILESIIFFLINFIFILLTLICIILFTKINSSFRLKEFSILKILLNRTFSFHIFIRFFFPKFFTLI